MQKEQIEGLLQAVTNDVEQMSQNITAMYTKLVPTIEDIHKQEQKIIGEAKSLVDTLLEVKFQLLKAQSAILASKQCLLQHLKGT